MLLPLQEEEEDVHHPHLLPEGGIRLLDESEKRTPMPRVYLCFSLHAFLTEAHDNGLSCTKYSNRSYNRCPPILLTSPLRRNLPSSESVFFLFRQGRSGICLSKPRQKLGSEAFPYFPRGKRIPKMVAAPIPSYLPQHKRTKGKTTQNASRCRNRFPFSA